MGFPSSVKRFVFSITKAQWVVIIFVATTIPIVAILVYCWNLNDDPPNTPTDPLADKYGPVIYVNMMYRHGARNPDRLPSKDPYNDLKYWPGGFGSLTVKGIVAHHHLGKWIADRYRHLLPTEWTSINNAIKVISTDWKRTLMSAEANLGGMFPVTADVSSWEGFSSYPVPIHSIPSADDGVSFGMVKLHKGRLDSPKYRYSDISAVPKLDTGVIVEMTPGTKVSTWSQFGRV